MKKFLVPLFFFLFLSCSNEDFESKIAASVQKRSYCNIKNKCVEDISESVCAELGEVINLTRCTELNGNLSSSSDNSSSSSSSAINSSSSYASSSSSSTISSSSNQTVSSSSSGGSSSSSIGNSSSSISSSSSSAISSSSSFKFKEECSPFPYDYVSKDKKEYIKDLASLEGDPAECVITYQVRATNGVSASISGDSISFLSASSTKQVLLIAASAQCGTTTVYKPSDCKIEVVVAEKFAEAKLCDDEDRHTRLSPGTTTVEVSCVKGEGPAKFFGCDSPSGEVWNADNVYTLNGIPANQWGHGWADAPIPDDLAKNEVKRILIDYSNSDNKEVGCTAH